MSVTSHDDVATEARTLVELIRAQNAGVLLVDEADAVRLVATALRVAEDRGALAGIDRMGAAAGRVFATNGAVS